MGESESQQQFKQEKPKSKKGSKQQKAKPKKKQPRKKKQKDKDKEKQQQKEDKKDKGKKKASKSKPKKPEKQLDSKAAKQSVLDYMNKQNRPYSLINIYDNLHGVIKKPALQAILEELCEQKQLSCKEFNKNKIYMLCQDKFNISSIQMDGLTSQLGNLRQQQKQLEQEVKQLSLNLKNLNAKFKLSELKKQVETKKNEIVKLQQKMIIYGGDWIGMDPKQVQKIQKQYAESIKQCKKREKLVRQGIKNWAQILQKKFLQTAQILGIDLE